MTGTSVLWNQVLALSYKNCLHVKRRFLSFLCMLLTPFLVVGMIMTLNFLISKYQVVDKLKNSDVDLGGKPELPEFMPKYIVPCNLINMELYSQYEEVRKNYKVKVWQKLVNYGLAERTIDVKRQAGRFLRRNPQFFGYPERRYYPRFFYESSESIEEMNERLVANIQQYGGNGIDLSDNKVPDASIFFNQFDTDAGFDAVIQQQNPRNDLDVRFNGYNFVAFRWDQNDSWSWLRIPTEGFVSTMNLLNNKFLLNQINREYQSPSNSWDDLPKVIAFMSPVMDSGMAREVLDSFFGALGVLFVPLALSFGYPALLLVLASDKETRVIDLLRVNGLNYLSYWTSYFLVYLTMLMCSTVTFLLAMIHLAEFKPFADSSFTLLIGYLLLWNVSQLTFALASARFIGTVSTAGFMGYIVGTFFMLVCSGVSLGVLPGYTEMPWVALMVTSPDPSFKFMHSNPHLVPQSNLVRFMYSISFQCVDTHCPNSPTDINPEAARCIRLQMYSAILSILVALLHDENVTVMSWIGKILKILVKKRQLTLPPARDRALEMQDSTARAFEAAAMNRAVGRILSDGQWKEAETQLERDTQTIQVPPEDGLMGSPKSAQSPKNVIINQSVHNFAQIYSSVLGAQHDRPEALIVNGVEYVYEPRVSAVEYLRRALFCCKKRNTTECTHAVRNVSLFVEEGQTLGILGPNGSGKTSLLKLVTGNSKLQVGKIWVSGSAVGYCPQFDLLFDDLSVRQHLTFFSLFKGAQLDQIETSLQGVDLLEHEHKTPAQLSGGMKRRTSLAISLLGECPLVVLDEPSSGLDPTQRRNFWNTLKKCTASRAVLITTHIMEEAEYLCDKIMVMVEGKIRTVGNTNELRSKYCGGARVEVFFPSDDREVRQRVIASIRGITEVEHSGKKCRLVVSNLQLSEAIAALQQLQEHGQINEWSVSRHTLEEVFLKVVGHYRQPAVERHMHGSTAIMESSPPAELELTSYRPN